MATPLSQIVLEAKDLADMLNNPVVAEPTWRRWINRGQDRLYRLLFSQEPGRFYTSANFTLTGVGGNTVALAAGWRRVLGVTKDPANQAARRTLRRFNFAQRDAQGSLPAWGAGRELRFDVQGSNIVVEPAQTCAGSYAYYYAAGPTPFATNGSDDAVNIASVFEPYVDFVATYTAIKALQKEESDASDMKQELEMLKQEIMDEFGSTSDPATIIDEQDTGGAYWP